MAQKQNATKPHASATDDSIENLETIFQLEKVLRFEKLLSALAAAFANLPPERVDQEIERGLKLAAEFLGADRAGISQYSPDRQSLDLTHRYVADGVAAHPLETFKPDEMFIWYQKALETKGVVVFENLPEDLPAKAEFERRFCLEHRIKSTIGLPLWTGEDTPDGYIGFVFLQDKRSWLPQCIERIHFMGQLFANVLRHQRSDLEIKRLKTLLEDENADLKKELGYGDILGHSEAMKTVIGQIEQVAPTDATVLIQGETGTGKELIARAIHKASPRRDKPMVRVNCAAIAPTLIESELFGHEKGAFTGADARQIGRFEIADGSTIFLDEIGELPADLQAKLLAVLELEQVERVGSTRAIDIDIRVVAATHKDLAAEVKAGNFREDLFYRLNVFPIQAPPLRQRPEDIPMLVWAFIQELSVKMGKVIQTVSPRTMEQLQRRDWSGNVRQLRNVVERAMILTRGTTLTVETPEPDAAPQPQSMALEAVERNHIARVLSMAGWKVRGQNGAAERLGLKPSTLESKMQKLGIKRPG